MLPLKPGRCGPLLSQCTGGVKKNWVKEQCATFGIPSSRSSSGKTSVRRTLSYGSAACGIALCTEDEVSSAQKRLPYSIRFPYGRRTEASVAREMESPHQPLAFIFKHKLPIQHAGECPGRSGESGWDALEDRPRSSCGR